MIGPSAEVARQLREERRVSAVMVLQDLPAEDREAICLAFLDASGPPAPGFLLDLQAEAEGWADRASAAELRAYGGAILRRLAGTVMVEAWRKRLMVALFQTLPVEWRHAFLGRVDPEGRYRGKDLPSGRRAA